MALKAHSAGYVPSSLYSSLTAAEPTTPPAQSPDLAVPGREVPDGRLAGRLRRVERQHAALALDVLLLHGLQQQALPGGHGRAVEVGADEVVPDDREVGAPETVHVAGAGRDVQVLAERRGGGLEHEVVVVVRVALVAEQQPLVLDDRLLPVRPRLRSSAGRARRTSRSRRRGRRRRRRRSRCRRSRGCSSRSAAPAAARAPCRCRTSRRARAPRAGRPACSGYPRRDPATTMYLSSGPVGDGFLNTDGLLLMMSSYLYAQTTSPVVASIRRSLYSYELAMT